MVALVEREGATMTTIIYRDYDITIKQQLLVLIVIGHIVVAGFPESGSRGPLLPAKRTATLP